MGELDLLLLLLPAKLKVKYESEKKRGKLGFIKGLDWVDLKPDPNPIAFNLQADWVSIGLS